MLKEICITPQVFDIDHIDISNWKDVKTLLETITISGYILGLNNNDWYIEVIQNINYLEIEKIQLALKEILKRLKDRGRIYGHPKEALNPKGEDDWLQIAKKLDDLRPFFSIIATKKNFEKIIELNNLENINICEEYGFTGSKHYIKDEDKLKNIFLPLLSYAKKLTIIDPYFYVHEKRYETTLNLIALFFKERRGLREKGSIIINCKWNQELQYNYSKWQKIIGNIFKEYGHIVTIQLWSRKGNNDLKLHERYLITESAGLYAGAGIDKDDYQQSEWGIKDYDQLDEIRSQYIENANFFKLESTITSSNINYYK